MTKINNNNSEDTNFHNSTAPIGANPTAFVGNSQDIIHLRLQMNNMQLLIQQQQKQIEEQKEQILHKMQYPMHAPNFPPMYHPPMHTPNFPPMYHPPMHTPIPPVSTPMPMPVQQPQVQQTFTPSFNKIEANINEKQTIEQRVTQPIEKPSIEESQKVVLEHANIPLKQKDNNSSTEDEIFNLEQIPKALIPLSIVRKLKGSQKVNLFIEWTILLNDITEKISRPNWNNKQEFTPGEFLVYITNSPYLLKGEKLQNIAIETLSIFLSRNSDELVDLFSILQQYKSLRKITRLKEDKPQLEIFSKMREYAQSSSQRRFTFSYKKDEKSSQTEKDLERYLRSRIDSNLSEMLSYTRQLKYEAFKDMASNETIYYKPYSDYHLFTKIYDAILKEAKSSYDAISAKKAERHKSKIAAKISENGEAKIS